MPAGHSPKGDGWRLVVAKAGFGFALSRERRGMNLGHGARGEGDQADQAQVALLLPGAEPQPDAPHGLSSTAMA